MSTSLTDLKPKKIVQVEIVKVTGSRQNREIKTRMTGAEELSKESDKDNIHPTSRLHGGDHQREKVREPGLK